MTLPVKLYHFGKTEHIREFVPKGQISFGLAAGFIRDGLTKGQKDDEMTRTATPPPATTSIHVGAAPKTSVPLQNLTSIRVGLGIRVPYFMKCFSLGYSDSMYAEVDGDMCVVIEDVTEFFKRFESALTDQLPDWAAFAAPAQYWDFARIPVGMTQRDLMFLKDSSQYSSQQEYRIVLIPPVSFVVTGSEMRQPLELASLTDIATEKRKTS